MKIKLGDYFIETDEKQYKVKKHMGKDKDGKDINKSIAYCTNLQIALKFIPQQAIRDNEDINIIIDKLSVIEEEIKAITNEMINSQERIKDLNRYIELNYEN